jgi:hypothetical protein
MRGLTDDNPDSSDEMTELLNSQADDILITDHEVGIRS